VNKTMRFVSIAALPIVMAGAAMAQPAKGKAPETMKIVSFTGQVQVKMADGSVIGIVPGAPVPAIPKDAEVVVLSGQAVFSVGNTVVTADKGDSFSFDVQGGKVEIAATGSKTEIAVSVGGSQAALGSGDAVSVGATQAGKAEISCTAGEVSVVTGSQTQTVAQGQSMSVAAPVVAMAPAASAAPVVPAQPAVPTVQPAVPAIPGETTATETPTTEATPEEIVLESTTEPVTELPPPVPAAEVAVDVSPSTP